MTSKTEQALMDAAERLKERNWDRFSPFDLALEVQAHEEADSMLSSGAVRKALAELVRNNLLRQVLETDWHYNPQRPQFYLAQSLPDGTVPVYRNDPDDAKREVDFGEACVRKGRLLPLATSTLLSFTLMVLSFMMVEADSVWFAAAIGTFTSVMGLYFANRARTGEHSFSDCFRCSVEHLMLLVSFSFVLDAMIFSAMAIMA